MKTLIFYTLFILLSSVCSAQTAEELYNKGMNNKETENYEDAIQNFTQAIS